MDATWLPLALAAAALSATAETSRKRLVRDLDPFAVAFVTAAIAAALLLPVLAFETGPVAWGDFGAAVLVSGGVNVVAAVLVARAYQTSDLSLVTPLRGLTPVFTLLVAALVLAEIPSWLGAVGVVTITAGTYLLATAVRGADAIGPLRALWADRGARAMLLVALLYGVSSTYDKVGTLASSPLVWALTLQGTVAVVTGTWVLRSEERRRALVELGRGGWIAAGVTGAATALMLAAQMTALTVGLAGYVIAVKRTSILFTVLASGLLFGERHLGARLLAAAVVVGGVVMLSLG